MGVWSGPHDPGMFGFNLGPDCYLRKGDEDTKMFWFQKLVFWSNFIIVLKRISARNLKNTLKPLKSVVWRSETTIFDKIVLRKKEVFVYWTLPLFKGPGRAHMGPYGPEKSWKIRKRFALLGAFKGPCTLPQATVWMIHLVRISLLSSILQRAVICIVTGQIEATHKQGVCRGASGAD